MKRCIPPTCDEPMTTDLPSYPRLRALVMWDQDFVARAEQLHCWGRHLFPVKSYASCWSSIDAVASSCVGLPTAYVRGPFDRSEGHWLLGKMRPVESHLSSPTQRASNTNGPMAHEQDHHTGPERGPGNRTQTQTKYEANWKCEWPVAYNRGENLLCPLLVSPRTTVQ
ncbi:hypothetical protein Ancab_026067 [Ancistrocladus abbreviatus]